MDETDPRVSAPDDGFPLMDEADSGAEQAKLDDEGPVFSDLRADFEAEH